MVHVNNSIIKHDILSFDRNVLYKCMVILDGREYMGGWIWIEKTSINNIVITATCCIDASAADDRSSELVPSGFPFFDDRKRMKKSIMDLDFGLSSKCYGIIILFFISIILYLRSVHHKYGTIRTISDIVLDFLILISDYIQVKSVSIFNSLSAKIVFTIATCLYYIYILSIFDFLLKVSGKKY